MIDLSDFCLWNQIPHDQIIQLSNFLCSNLSQLYIISNVYLYTITLNYALRQKLKNFEKIIIKRIPIEIEALVKIQIFLFPKKCIF